MSSKQKAERKPSGIERLVAAAQALLAEAGLEGVNSNAVAERAGLTPPAFYHYFPNKHALLRELGERMLSAQSTAIRTDTGRRVRTPADLRDICRDMLSESLRLQLAGTTVKVSELEPPSVATDLMPGQRESEFAMPLDEFIAEVVGLIETDPDAREIQVERVKFLRYGEARGDYDETVAALNHLDPHGR